MQQPIRATDLWGLIEALKGHELYGKIRGLAEQAQRAQSCVADLTLAESCCETFAQLNRPDAFDPLIVTEVAQLTARHSLIANAVSLYTRATSTHSGGGERGSISIEDRLSEGDLREHHILIGVRNKSLAHVHSNEAVGEVVWHQERMILRDDGVPGCVTRRVQIDAETMTRLRHLIPIAKNLIRETFLRKITGLTQCLREVRFPIDLLDQHPFDLISFFGSEAEARRALRPRPGGSAVGVAR